MATLILRERRGSHKQERTVKVQKVNQGPGQESGGQGILIQKVLKYVVGKNRILGCDH